MWFPSFSMEIDFEEKGKLIPASKLRDFLGEVSESSHWRWTEYSSEQKIKFRCPVSVSAVTTGLESHSILSFSKQRTIPNPRSYLHMSESFGWHCCPAFRSLFFIFFFPLMSLLCRAKASVTIGTAVRANTASFCVSNQLFPQKRMREVV